MFLLFYFQGRCNRDKPPCKYFHPPQHLKDQLLINGRNHLALKNALMQQMGIAPGQPVIPGQVPQVVSTIKLFYININTSTNQRQIITFINSFKRKILAVINFS